MSSNSTFGPYTLVNKELSEFLVCYTRNQTVNISTWQAVNPLINSLPLFIFQLFVIIFTTRLVSLILKPLRQPRLVADIISGLLLGATVMDHLKMIAAIMFPFESNLILETMANIGLMYYMFLMGLEMDLTPIRHIGKKALSIAIAGILPPMVVGVGLYHLIKKESETATATQLGGVFWAIALTVTSFPDLARLLSDLKLMHTDLGRTALTSAMVNDMVSWALLILAITKLNGQTIVMCLPTIIFIPICWFVLRPAVCWCIRHSADSEDLSSFEVTQGKYNDKHVHFIMAVVPIFGFITDAFGSNSMTGAFLFGLIIPNGELGMRVMERLEEYVTGILLPAFFLSNGLRTNLFFLFPISSNPVVFPTIILTCFTKIVSTLVVSSFFDFKMWDGFALGVLMNTKGVLGLIVLNSGKNLKGFDQQTFAAMMLAFLIMTFAVSPFITFAYKPTKRFKQFTQKTLEKSKPDSELRVMTCVHSIRNATGMINLLQVSNPSKKSPLSIFAVHLVELTGRATAAMLIFHDTLKSGANNRSREKAEDNQIISAFESFESKNTNVVSVQPLTVVSSYPSMHEDIINFVEDKCVSLILVPFHKQPTPDGKFEDENPSIRQVNQNLLASSPCSVGIFVDRGLSSIKLEESSHDRQNLRFAMLFIGGSDDREALAYAWRMAETPLVTLTVVRFLPGKDAQDITPDDVTSDDGTGGILMTLANIQKDQLLDDAYINEFRFRSMFNESITYVDKLVNSGDQVIEAITTSYDDFDLYVVGRGEGRQSALTLGLTEWSDCPELGAIGDLLVQSELASIASVLIVQQNAPGSSHYEGEKLGHTPAMEKPEFEAFVNHRRKDDHYD